MATSNLPLASSLTTSSANRQSDIRDGWDNDEWGSLEEEPVSSGTHSNRRLPICQVLFVPFQNEDEREENDVTISNAKSNENETTSIRSTAQKNTEHTARPNDLPNLISNHTTATSPMTLNSNSNAVWNSDSWADGEFEPLEEPTSGKFH